MTNTHTKSPSSESIGAKRPESSLGKTDRAIPNEKSDVGMQKRLIQHLKRRRIFYVVGAVVFLAIFLPVLFTVIISAVIQRFVNNRVVLLDHASVQLHASDSIMLHANATFDSPLPARLGDLALQLSGQLELASLPAFINFSVPGFHVSSPTTHVKVAESELYIANETDLVDWAMRFVRDETIPISVLSDSLGVFLGRLPYSARVNKTILVKGLSTLDDITIPTLNLNLAAHDGNNLAGTIVLDNTSSLSILVGNITLNLLVSDIKIGTIYIPNVNLMPGSNALPIVGNVDIGVIIGNIGKILINQQGVLQSGHIIVALTGNTTCFNRHHIRYVDTLLTTRPLSVKVTLETLLNTILGVAVDISSGGRLGQNISVSSIIGTLSSMLANKTFIAGLQSNWHNHGSMRQPQGLEMKWPIL